MQRKSILAALAATAVLCLAVPAAAETFTASNGVLSIELPNENWKEMMDPSKWITLSDGSNMITIEHFSNGANLPEMSVADSHYVNVYQAVFSTQNEVFIITGSVVDAANIPQICNAIMSTKVLQYNTKTAVKPETPAPKTSEFTLAAMDQTMYVISDSLNIRGGCSTNDAIIGALTYGDSIRVLGSVQRNGADYGWYQVSFNNGTGYVSSAFLSATAPASKSTDSAAKSEESGSSKGFTGNVKTIYEIDGYAVTVYESVDGYWYDNAGTRYDWITTYEFAAENGAVLTVNKPVVDSGLEPTGFSMEVYWLNGNGTTLYEYSDGYYYTSDWVRYSSNGDGTYSGADGTTLYMFAPDLSGNQTANTDTSTVYLISRGSGRPVTVYESEDGVYYDREGIAFHKQEDGTFKDAYDAVYDVTETPRSGSTKENGDRYAYEGDVSNNSTVRLISRETGEEVVISIQGGVYYDAYGTEFGKVDSETFIDENDKLYDVEH